MFKMAEYTTEQQMVKDSLTRGINKMVRRKEV